MTTSVVITDPAATTAITAAAAAATPRPLLLQPPPHVLMFSDSKKIPELRPSVLPQSTGVTEFSGTYHIKINRPFIIRDGGML